MATITVLGHTEHMVLGVEFTDDDDLRVTVTQFFKDGWYLDNVIKGTDNRAIVQLKRKPMEL